ncbi:MULTISPECIES: SDR family oxidoreductase [unclassified Rhodococcus (in: high G+C Gram-positive bacteria)]|uniref:SDR family oxidoreductase n=1 Tax=unclassified Rhodococcus (in: high G+C Gram-positive bacteria) TaxID=192944 RepID=UPI000B9A6DCD|nr:MULTISPECIES: SDR family oxidoreductase [unclassified Rhodococcus (in: high G+C Gram-positive bacteria)]OZE31656.1 3-ketoacyl-ACP reductase [Rhodococcus sp. 05-2254-4]OZE42587.1 3-ketoacyl-ACP reductase [Rhodococcus sp. 05-2254-3]OZE46743.1 3-ketoacyl-ACP reductase [Rhodococcus sp. 05-2254-2]
MNSDGRTVLVTGVGRRLGIGYAITRRLLQDERGRVFVQSCDSYDVSEPWGAGTPGAVQVLAELSTAPSRLGHLDIDLSDPEAPAALFDAAESRFGAVDSLVINHARSQLGDVGSLTAESLDLTWAVNVRASLLLVQEFAERYVDHRDGGRIVLFTSGQGEGPMPTEIPYAVTKGAIAAITPTLADSLIERGITVNTINPGPTDTGWASADLDTFVLRHMPRGRWNSPDEAAAVVAMLLSPDSGSITGQVIGAEGGFRRFTP